MLEDLDDNDIAALKEVYRILKNHFSYDENKILVWIFARNPNLGNVKPAYMIMSGRGPKLVQWMKDQISGNCA